MLVQSLCDFMDNKSTLLMKKLCNLLMAASLLVCLTAYQAGAQGSVSQDKATKASEVSDLISGGRYTFVATKELSGKNNGETLSGYDLDVSKDTLVAHLPGYHRVIPSSIGDNSLTCNHFSYDVVSGGNGSRIVTIKPHSGNAGDMANISEFKLDISALGYATLTVKGSNPVTCHGYIREHIANFKPVSARIK